MADAVRRATLSASGVVPGGGNWEIWKVFDAELVNGTASVESLRAGAGRGFDLTQFRFFGLWVNPTSVGGTANISVRLLQSWDDTAANYIIPDTGGTVTASISDELPHAYSLAPVPMRFQRVRLVGVGTNPTDTVVDAYLFLQS